MCVYVLILAHIAPPTGKTSQKMIFHKMKLCICFLFTLLPSLSANLKEGFYQSTCPHVEAIVRGVVENRYNKDRSVTAALLRMQFHDILCGSESHKLGCDGSILIDPTAERPSEKTAVPNLTVRGFDIIDEAKEAVEAQCPSTVSCADIITLATRDAVTLAGGPNYTIATGRRDGLLSDPHLVNLPDPGFSVPHALDSFTAKGFTLEDMVTLLGAHTVGFAHCKFFENRLSDFKGTGSPDPSMDPVLRSRLAQSCRIGQDPRVFLDQNTPLVLDNKFYKQVLSKGGVLRIDQELSLNSSSGETVSKLAADGILFSQQFGVAMKKLGEVEVLVGDAGEIRKHCRKFNQ